MAYLHSGMNRERLVISLHAVAAGAICLEKGLEWCKTRKVRGTPIGQLQANAHDLVDLRVELQLMRLFVDNLVRDWDNNHSWAPETTAIAKYKSTELQFKIISTVMQLYGATSLLASQPGSDLPLPLIKMLANSRIQMIYGGANQAMKDAVAGSMGLTN